ncbi:MULTISPECIES: Gfo/Idh/MocA family protein [Flagellimonas]|uniref:Gfo/Idh/MocA family oxidoreductase n=1 Tax=Flagellimonas hadalis TaxID=2597517 RepID=A0A5N5IUU5_9FLAO|nr:Gfo/Idh/MocA family oxidoreductase [Allomuricauda hadalis]KAB5488836.1 Gfo/Idh/MocA family oxidoreductase [Allomuricauda hadalis]
MKPLKFAIVGCGRIGNRHAKHIANNGILKAVCDVDFGRADTLAKEYGASAYPSIEDMLANEKDIDLVAICSPNGLHAAHSIKVLKSGIHVLCEKPMATSVYDCGEMIKTAESANKRLMIVKQNRFNPPVEAVKRLIDSGKLGRIFSVQLSCFWNRNEDYYHNSWKGSLDLDGGTLYTQFSHFIDLLYWMIGDVKNVEAFGGNFNHQDIAEFDDNGVIALKFYNGAIGTINYTVNSFGKNMEGSLTIFGEKGTVKIGGQYLNELEYQNIDGEVIGDLPEGNTANNYGQYQGSMSNHDRVYENVVEVLTNDGVISANGFEGLKTVEIIDKIYNKMKGRFEAI